MEDPAVVSELRQELEEVREEASSTKEELSLYRERSDKLQEELLVREHAFRHYLTTVFSLHV